MTTTKEETRYEVTWMTSLPLDECGDGDFSRATFEKRWFPTLREARTFAGMVVKRDLPMRLAQIHRQLYKSEGESGFRWGKWETAGEMEEVLP